MKPTHIFQIYYDDASCGALDPAFLPLDNSRNARPDWREYWPIRQFLSSTELDDDAYYGFLSPKFRQKTGLSGEAVIAFIESVEADVYLFSPFVEATAFFLNVFENGETNHPGLIALTQQIADAAGLGLYVTGTVCDFSTAVYSNYLVARPAFWAKWLAINEYMFAICERGGSPLADSLNAATDYPSQVRAVAMKVFVMERIASLVLLTSRFVVRTFDPFALSRSGIPASCRDHDMRIAVALKMAYLATGDTRYIESFNLHRTAVIADIQKPGSRSRYD